MKGHFRFLCPIVPNGGIATPSTAALLRVEAGTFPPPAIFPAVSERGSHALRECERIRSNGDEKLSAFGRSGHVGV
jgi:hypothetical protein